MPKVTHSESVFFSWGWEVQLTLWETLLLPQWGAKTGRKGLRLPKGKLSLRVPGR